MQSNKRFLTILVLHLQNWEKIDGVVEFLTLYSIHPHPVRGLQRTPFFLSLCHVALRHLHTSPLLLSSAWPGHWWHNLIPHCGGLDRQILVPMVARRE